MSQLNLSKTSYAAIETKLATQLKPLPPSTELKFGQYFSDHWFFAKYSEEKGWHQSSIEPYQKFELDPAASVLHYGQALFEGMKAFSQNDQSIKLFRPDFNYDRMAFGAERLCLAMPPKELFINGIRELIKVDQRWVPKEPNCSLYIRPTLIGTEGFLGVRPSREVLFFVLLSPVGSYFQSGSSAVKIWVETETLRAAPGGLGATKAGANYAASLKAALNARSKGYDQVLWLDVEQKGIEEVGTMNVFFVFKNEIITPALNGSILAGGVRDSVIQLLKHENKNLIERKITMPEVVERSQKGELLEAFGTGTAAVITPIAEFFYQQKTIKLAGAEGPLGQDLMKKITGIQRGTTTDPFGWMVNV